MICHHYCNCELTCPECIRRFWKWAENHTRGRKPKGSETRGPSFYEAAAQWGQTQPNPARNWGAVIPGGTT